MSTAGTRRTEVEAQAWLEVAKVEVAKKSQAKAVAEKLRAEVKVDKAKAKAKVTAPSAVKKKGPGGVKKASGSMI